MNFENTKKLIEENTGNWISDDQLSDVFEADGVSQQDQANFRDCLSDVGMVRDNLRNKMNEWFMERQIPVVMLDVNMDEDTPDENVLWWKMEFIGE